MDNVVLTDVLEEWASHIEHEDPSLYTIKLLRDAAARIRELEAESARDHEQLERVYAGYRELFELMSACHTCGGVPPVSGLNCFCGGSGLARDELAGLRLRILELEVEHDALLTPL